MRARCHKRCASSFPCCHVRAGTVGSPRLVGIGDAPPSDITPRFPESWSGTLDRVIFVVCFLCGLAVQGCCCRRRRTSRAFCNAQPHDELVFVPVRVLSRGGFACDLVVLLTCYFYSFVAGAVVRRGFWSTAEMVLMSSTWQLCGFWFAEVRWKTSERY